MNDVKMAAGKESAKSNTNIPQVIQPTLTSRQQAELDKINWEIMRTNAKMWNEMFEGNLKVDGLAEEQENYDEVRQNSLYWQIASLSQTPITVETVYCLAEVITRTTEVKNCSKRADQKEILREKFKFLHDLARACKITLQDLLLNLSKKIYSRLTEMLLMNPYTMELIGHFIGIEFF